MDCNECFHKEVCAGFEVTQKDCRHFKKQENIIELLCKPSDITVYQLRSKKYACGAGIHPRHISCTMVWGNKKYELHHQGMEPCRGEDFQKTWFLSYEGAQQFWITKQKNISDK